jgi:pimeloyl-ACP methyl ester carboxylesterase
MASNQVLDFPIHVATSTEIVFAGDEVRLAGQIEYPVTARPENGYPLVFILHHACCNAREDYDDYAQIGLANGYAVFRWDKRGTGRSGDSGRGSTTQDAVNAYDIAISQPDVNRKRVVILAVGAGSALLGSSYGLFARTQQPYAALLVANMLDESEILALDTRIKIVMSPDDWNSPQRFGEAASAAHKQAYRHGASFFLAPGGDRLLMETDDYGRSALHPSARKVIGDWLNSLTRLSASI